ncbi:Hypothetical predicted protein [Olea europaea subsp. europaea]|uniref:Uncharacterized protein n=1 Tax=Olea europaea subsp. europaea TaxID=158383 RepID=A0A8S0VLU5_OLEEU|nr:Hypothetical predicted protein [Olea europaea subsp. europaea]
MENNREFKTPSLKLVNFPKRRILVGHNIDDKKFYITAAFREADWKLLDIRDMAKDLAIYGVEDLKVEAAVKKALGMEIGDAIGSVQMKKR